MASASLRRANGPGARSGTLALELLQRDSTDEHQPDRALAAEVDQHPLGGLVRLDDSAEAVLVVVDPVADVQGDRRLERGLRDVPAAAVGGGGAATEPEPPDRGRALRL